MVKSFLVVARLLVLNFWGWIPIFWWGLTFWGWIWILLLILIFLICMGFCSIGYDLFFSYVTTFFSSETMITLRHVLHHWTSYGEFVFLVFFAGFFWRRTRAGWVWAHSREDAHVGWEDASSRIIWLQWKWKESLFSSCLNLKSGWEF